MSDEITETYDADGDGTDETSVTWTDEGGSSDYYESGSVDVDGDGEEDYAMSDTDEDGVVDEMTGDFNGDGTDDSWSDEDGDHTVDQNEIDMS